MPRIVRLLCLLASLAGLPAAALDLDETRRLAHAMDIDGLEQAFSSLHAAVDDGTVPQSDQRHAYVAFSTTDPRLHEAVAAWRDRYPQSIYAQTAELWTLYTLAWHVRGTRAVHETHPDALREFRTMMEAAQALAITVYSRDDRFLPASDGIFRTALVVRPDVQTDVFLAEIMENVPNYGSLHRALGLTHPRWGGSWNEVVRLCETFADSVPDRDGFTDRTCKINAGLDYGHDVGRIARLAMDLGDFDSETLRPWRLQDALFLRPHRIGAPEMAREAVEAERFRNTRLAIAYDQRVAGPKGWPAMTGVVQRRAFAAAQEDLANDPYNPGLIETLAASYIHILKPDPETAAAIERDLTARRLMFDRFNPTGWAELARLTSAPFDYDAPFRSVAYYENAAAYGNHRPLYVRMVLDHWYAMIVDRQRLDNAPIRMRFTRAYIEAKNSSFAERDIVEFLCPFARAYRLFEAVCADRANDPSCTLYEPQRSALAATFEMASDGNLCPRETLSTLDTLVYLPVELEIPHSPTISD